MDKWIDKPVIDLYSDGGACPNPGKGGYGIILSWNGIRKEFSKGYKHTTNNRMELRGVIAGLEKLKTTSVVHIYTDSKYVINGIEKGWALKWKSKNWYRNQTEKAINVDLWSRLLDLVAKHEVTFTWVKGHNGHPENERCDQLASSALESEDLFEDEGFEAAETQSPSKPNEPQTKIQKSKRKITKEGDLCRHCETPVNLKVPTRKTIKPNQQFYYEYYLHCPTCKALYMLEEAKMPIDSVQSFL
jgi:ribonuclease HI